MEWINLLNVIGGALASLGGIGIFKVLTSNGRKEIKADADKKVQEAEALMIQNYEERIKELHENKKKLNEEVDYYIERISAQNKAIDSKTEQIRSLTQQVWDSQQQLNEANARITALTEERDKYKMWHCKSNSCVKGNPDPEGRQPPNPLIIGQTFPG